MVKSATLLQCFSASLSVLALSSRFDGPTGLSSRLPSGVTFSTRSVESF